MVSTALSLASMVYGKQGPQSLQRPQIDSRTFAAPSPVSSYRKKLICAIQRVSIPFHTQYSILLHADANASPAGCEVRCSTYLDEPNILALLAEALTADVQAVLPDQTGLVRAHSAAAGALAEFARARVPD